MRLLNIIAIDPGASGGIAFAADPTLSNIVRSVEWSVSGQRRICAIKMPCSEADLLTLFRDINHGWDRVFIERVSGYAGSGQPGSAMFRFGEGYGFLRGLIQALGYSAVLVSPQTWQRPLGIGTSRQCATRADWKRKLKDEAARRFPMLKVTLATADALLILDWAMTTYHEVDNVHTGVDAGHNQRHENSNAQVASPQTGQCQGRQAMFL